MDSLTEKIQALIPASVSVLMLVKISILLLAGWLVSLFLRRQAASYRHTIWFSLLLALLLLPVFNNLIPDMLLRVDADHWFYRLMTGGESTLNPDLARFSINAIIWTWCLITAVLLLQLLISILRVAGITRRAVPLSSSSLHVASLDELVRVAGAGVKIKLLKSREIASPVSWGLLRPVILLPEDADEWSAESGRDVLAHELAHIERNDWLSLVIARVTLAFYWFHPLVWWAYARLMEEAEHACDDAVVLDHRNAEYADTLLSMARHKQGIYQLAVQAMAQSFLGKRINAILDKGVLRSYSESVFLVRACLVGVVLAALAASLELAPVAPVQARPFTISMPDSGPAERAESLFVDSLEPAAVGNPPDLALLEQLPAVPHLRTIVQRDQIDAYLLAQQQNSMQFSSVMSETVPGVATDPVRILIHQQIPEYPKRARARGIEGQVLASYTINPDGSLSDIEIIESQPRRVFDRAVLDALSTFRFSRLPPSTGDAGRQETRVQTFVFRLETDP